jgi:uncharacterized RDD family membrane protein YckC
MDIKELSGYNFGEEAEKAKRESIKSNMRKLSFSQRTFSYSIDFLIVSVIRFLASSILAAIWYNAKFKKLVETNGFDPERALEFFIKYDVIYDFVVFTIIILFTGGLYFVFFYASKWGTTIGGMLLDIKLVIKKNGERVNLGRSFMRYILCLVPLFCICWIGIKYYNKSFDLLFILLFIFSALWYDLSIILRLPQGIPDLLTGTVFISTKEIKKKDSLQNKKEK